MGKGEGDLEWQHKWEAELTIGMMCQAEPDVLHGKRRQRKGADVDEAVQSAKRCSCGRPFPTGLFVRVLVEKTLEKGCMQS